MENHIKGMHHLGMRSENFEKTAKFYQEGLGFTIRHEWFGDDHCYMLDMGDGHLIELFAKGEGLPAEGMWCRLAIATDDIQASYDRAIKAGAKPLSPPAYSNIVQAKPKAMKMYHAHVIGFDGEHIQFTQRIEED